MIRTLSPLKEEKFLKIVANPLRILIVDDEPDILESLRQLIDITNRVTLANTGHTAIELLKFNRYNLIFLDIKLPDISGLDVLQYIQKFHIDTSVVMMTGLATIAEADHAIILGAHEVLPKPIKPSRIEEIIREWEIGENRKKAEYDIPK